MFNVVKKEIQWGDRTLSIETGKIANLADGAVLVTYGETVVLCTVTADKKSGERPSFFPLTVSYQEKFFASGKIPGGFLKREGRPSENEILTSRLIDRPIRPCFHKDYYKNTQIVCTVFSYDKVNNPDIISLIGASAALSISGLPFMEILAAVRVGLIDDKFSINPTIEDLKKTSLDLIVAGNDKSVVMVESEANFLTESKMLEALDFAHKSIQPVISMISEFSNQINKPIIQVEEGLDNSENLKLIEKFSSPSIKEAYLSDSKISRNNALSKAREEVLEKVKEAQGDDFKESEALSALDDFEKKLVRDLILKENKRIDGRSPVDIRPIVSEVSYLPKTHGSALFSRGETQALVVATLGTKSDMQIVDGLNKDYKESFMLHYNFPPYSVGEASMLRPPGRREIGHGKLAWRALKASLPPFEEFPYTIRVVSEITSCYGSSSMATVCGSSLALMDSGVPLKDTVAGIAMGLIKDNDNFVILSDILGDEDRLGDMDFKVAGSESGISALQMDIKIKGIDIEIMRKALEQARLGRVHIIKEMKSTLSKSRSELNKNAPQIVSIKINPSKIGDVIGSGGKVIKEICETTGAEIDIGEDGNINVSAVNKDSIDKALDFIKSITTEIEVGSIIEAKVKSIMKFGAIVSFGGRNTGLVHISEISNERVENVESVLGVGDQVKVKVLSFDKGKYRLSMKKVDQKTGAEVDTKKFVKTSEDAPVRKKTKSSDNTVSKNDDEKASSESGFDKAKMWDDWG